MFSKFKSIIHLTYLRIRTFFREYARWINHNQDNTLCKVFYGHDYIPGIGEKASGGIIKAQDLQQIFPNILKDANIIYLISSALPYFPQYLIKLARNKGVKLVWNQNGVAYPAWHGPGWEDANRKLSYLMHKADYVIYQSNFCKLSADRYLGKYRGKSEVLYNPVDTNVFIPPSISAKGFKVLLAGTHNEWYRINVALKSFQKILFSIPEAELLIAGPLRWEKAVDKAKQDLHDLCVRLGILNKIKILGPYSQLDAVQLFQSAHVLLHTQYNDACPRLVVEAMACGLPVVYSASGGTPELVGEEGGIGIKTPLDWDSVQMVDPKDMADAVYIVYRNYNNYSTNARERAVKMFDVKPWLNRHKELFSIVLE